MGVKMASIARSANKRTLLAWSLVACIAVIGLALVSSSSTYLTSEQGPAVVVRMLPLSVGNNDRMEISLPKDRLKAALVPIAQFDFSRWGALTHGLRLWGTQADGPSQWTGEKMLDVVCSAEESQKAFGFAPHLLNRNGLQFMHKAEFNGFKQAKTVQGEKHLDEALAALAEVGVPSDRQIRVWDQTTTVSEAVRAAASNFTLDQLLDFTPVALALYLPPQTTWTNKFGERFSFDDVCPRLCDQALGEGGCYGCHAMYSLATILAADKQHRILSDVSRRRVRSKLQQAVGALRKSQREDGTWDAKWFDPLTPAPPKDIAATITATGHSLEWLAIVPQESVDDPKMIRRACEGALTLLLTATPASLGDNYNYYTHVANALKLWSPQSWNAANPAVALGTPVDAGAKSVAVSNEPRPPLEKSSNE